MMPPDSTTACTVPLATNRSSRTVWAKADGLTRHATTTIVTAIAGRLRHSEPVDAREVMRFMGGPPREGAARCWPVAVGEPAGLCAAEPRPVLGTRSTENSLDGMRVV